MRLTALANEFGSDKGTKSGDWGVAHHYTEVYERFLSARANEPLRILEIGVWKGSSLRMWEEYFPNATIIGLDILPEAASIEAKRARVVIGDASDAAFLLSVVDDCLGGAIDLVIDDGSHVLENQIVALEALFPRLNDHGLYFVEDVSVSRFASAGLGRLPFYDFLDYASALSELTTFFADFHSDTYHTIGDVRFLESANIKFPPAGFWNLNLLGVYFFHNMCVFERHRRVLSEGVRELPDLGNIRPAQGNAHAYKALTEPAKGEAGNQLAATQVFLGSIAAVQQSLQEGLIDMAVGRRLIEINDSVPEALANLVVDYEKLFSRLDSQMISVRCETDRLIKQYYDDRTFLGRALSRLNLREAEFERLRASSEQANLVQHAIQTKLSDALARNETLTAKLAEARTQNETLNRELSAESTSNDALSRSLLDVRAQSETSAGELAAERAKNNILNADLTGVHAQNDRLRRELITSRNEIETLGADLATARTQIDAMQAEISEARNENDALRNNVASATAHNEALSEDLRSAVTERHALRTELVARRAENDSLRGDRALMRTQHEALSAQLATALGQNDWLRTELERRKAQLRKFKRSVSWQVTSPLRVIKRVVFAFVPKTQRP